MVHALSNSGYSVNVEIVTILYVSLLNSVSRLSGPRVISTLLIDPTQVESKKSSQIQWPVPSINAEPVDIFLGEE